MHYRIKLIPVTKRALARLSWRNYEGTSRHLKHECTRVIIAKLRPLH